MRVKLDSGHQIVPGREKIARSEKWSRFDENFSVRGEHIIDCADYGLNFEMEIYVPRYTGIVCFSTHVLDYGIFHLCLSAVGLSLLLPVFFRSTIQFHPPESCFEIIAIQNSTSTFISFDI
jgi:hypothetical protein